MGLAAIVVFIFWGGGHTWVAEAASCGHYVIIGNPAVQDLAEAGEDIHEQGSTRPHFSPGEGAAPFGPCRGPSCERDVPLAPVPVPAVVVSVQDLWVCWLAVAVAPPDAPRWGLLQQRHLFLSQGHRMPVERPPRV